MKRLIGPIGQTIDNWQERKTIRLSMPGHKGNDSVLSKLSHYRDVTELPGFDNLHSPIACIKESQSQIADMYGVQESYYLLNGASGGLKAALLAMQDQARTIRIPRNAHISVWQGCLLAGLEPIYIQPDYHHGLVLPPTTESYQAKEADATLVLTTSYEGAVIDYAALAAEGILIADEAHGSHLPFGPLPSAVDYADIVVHGTHKTLGSLTQSGLLHSNNTQLTERLREALSLMGSTSPSWLLLSSVEEAVLYWQQMRKRGDLDGLWERCELLKRRINRISGFRIPEDKLGVHWDPLHLCIQTEDGLSSRELLTILDREFAIDMEMATEGHIVGLLGPFDVPGSDESLLTALQAVSRTLGLKDRFGKREGLCWPQTVQDVSLQQAYEADKRLVNLIEAVGYVAAEAVSAYPPGIPLLLPGERISREICGTLVDLQKQGVWIEGLTEGKLRIVED
jgi:ornithine decarboxylase